MAPPGGGNNTNSRFLCFFVRSVPFFRLLVLTPMPLSTTSTQTQTLSSTSSSLPQTSDPAKWTRLLPSLGALQVFPSPHMVVLGTQRCLASIVLTSSINLPSRGETECQGQLGQPSCTLSLVIRQPINCLIVLQLLAAPTVHVTHFILKTSTGQLFILSKSGRFQ